MNKWISALIFTITCHSALANSSEEIIRTLYSADIQEVEKLNTNTNLMLEIKEIELNDRHPKEILARFLHSYFCGTLGCKTIIVSHNGNAWTQITPYLVTHGEIVITENINNGFHSVKFDNGKLFDFNGKEYQ